jgi:hypothetical protein
LREFGFIKLFRKVFKKDDYKHYIVYFPEREKLEQVTRKQGERTHLLTFKEN